MQGRAEFDIIGNVGRITKFANSVKVSVCANYRGKDEHGNRVEHEYWNTVTVFTASTVSFIDKYVRPGDLVAVRGRVRQGSYEKNGETVYTTDFTATDLQLLTSKNRDSTPGAPPPADDIPF